MNEDALGVISRFEDSINKKRLFFKLQLSSLCVKSDPMSLLTIKVEDGGEMLNVEDVADVVKKDDSSLILIPHEGRSIEQLALAVTEVHPEFKQVYSLAKMSPTDDRTVTLLNLIMPEVDDKRHDILIKGVDTFSDAIIKAIDADKVYYSAKMALYMNDATEADREEVKNSMEDGVKACKDMVGEDADQKKKDIDDAYAAYQAKQEEKKNLGELKGMVDEKGADVVNSMKME